MLRSVLFIVQSLGILLGVLSCLWPGCRYRYTKTNLRLCFPELSAREINRLTHASLLEAGKLIAETVFFWFAPTAWWLQSVRQIHGEEHIQTALDAGRGVILVFPHLGNWEIFNVCASRYRAVILYKAPKNKWLNRWLRHCRERLGAVMVPIGNAGIKALRKTLHQGGVIALLPDQVPKYGGRVLAPFCGVPAWTGTLVSRLAQQHNAAVICSFTQRLPQAQGFVIYLSPVADAIYSEDMQRSAHALNQSIETFIRRCPEQYNWEYKRYKGGLYPQLYNKDGLVCRTDHSNK